MKGSTFAKHLITKNKHTMNLEQKYKEDYILLAGLREYVEKGTILASVNYYRDAAQNLKELDAIAHREDILAKKPEYLESEFLAAFVKEDFPDIEEKIPDNILSLGMQLIEKNEGPEIKTLTKKFLIDYATVIAKSSKEDWLSFIGLKDSISDEEEAFINRLWEHLNLEGV